MNKGFPRRDSKQGSTSRRPRSGQPPGVVAFTGHMMDRVGRVPPRFVPRFPKQKEDAVTQAIHDTLERLDARIGFCSAACGGDIVFIEQMLKRGGEVHVVLPYAEDLFVRDCIEVPDQAPPDQQFQENAGKKWLPRFRKIRKQVTSLITLGDKRAQDNTMASDCCNRVALGLGLLWAESASTSLTLVALWDGWSGDAPGGTRSLVKLADALKVRIEYLPPLLPEKVTDVIRSATPPPGIGAQPHRATLSQEPPQQICAVLFADVMRYGELDETRLPDFVSGFLQPLGSMIQKARHLGYGPLDFNTWGDGLFCVFDSMLKAGRFALALQQVTISGEWRITGSVEKLKLRIALHAGPIYRIPDPVFPKDGFIGTNVNFAARMEPVTPPGEISCSQAFAALAAAEGVQDFRCEFLRETVFPKGAGTHPLYLLKRRSH
ncbi:MAG TPA: adenylate/guanylate cyclase domain-containing protein [Chthoniobacterales bacterium]|nr:adenylate/guanylate cyclase domain-containing protein [Chthoniobacterales bacterium]